MGGPSRSAEVKKLLALAHSYIGMPDGELGRLFAEAAAEWGPGRPSDQKPDSGSSTRALLDQLKNQVMSEAGAGPATVSAIASAVVDRAREMGLDLSAYGPSLAILAAMVARAVQADPEDQPTYRDFDLSIKPAAAGSYRAQVLYSPAGMSSPVQFRLPFSTGEVEALLLRVGRSPAGGPRPAQPENALLKDFGERLFGAVFREGLRETLQRSLSLTEAQRERMRLRLHLTDTPELAELPWELLYDPSGNDFLAQSGSTPVVRYLDLPGSPRPLDVEGPLRLLVMTSSPRGYPSLDVEHEWNVVASALDRPRAEGRVVVEHLTGNMNSLQERLGREEFHVLHFIGHGIDRPGRGDGVLVMEDQAGGSQEVTGEQLGTLLRRSGQTRLAVLNACEVGRATASDQFAGVAQSLVQQGLPAVVATQFQITDVAAATFANELYSRIAEGAPLEAAVAASRGAIWAEGDIAEWAAPAVYSRIQGGRLFDLTGRGEGPAGVSPEEDKQPPTTDQGDRIFEADSPSGPEFAGPPGAPTGAEQPELFWNTRFPEDKGILLYEPHVVVTHAEYLLETGLGTKAEKGAESKPQKAAELLNAQIRYQLEAENGDFRPVDSDSWDVKLVSDPLTCTERGTKPFQVVYRAGKPGRAVVKALLIVGNGVVDQQEIVLRVEGDGAAVETDARSSGADAPVRTVGRSVRNAPSPDYRFTIRRWFADLWHENTQLVDVRLPEELSFQLGQVADKLYGDLRDISLMCSPRSSPERPLKLTNSGEGKLRLAKVGAQLHHRLFREPINPIEGNFLQKMGAIADRLSREGSEGDPPLLQIHATDYPLPWGLLYDRSADGGNDLRTADDVDPAGFWGRRFDIYRSVVSVERDARRGERRLVKPVIGAYVPRGEEQRGFVDRLRSGVRDATLMVDETSSNAADLMDWAISGADSDLLYLFCHARPAHYDGYAGTATSCLGFGASDNEDEDELRVGLEQLQHWWAERRPTNPIVFLNACSSGQQNLVYGAPFVNFFLEKWGAQAFIGTDWPINASLADMFGRQILDEVLQHRRSLRHAFRSVSDAAAAESNYFPLIYAIYGLSTVQFVDPLLTS